MAEKLSRKQFHFRPSERGLCAWDIDRLIELTQDLPVTSASIQTIFLRSRPVGVKTVGAVGDRGQVPLSARGTLERVGAAT